MYNLTKLDLLWKWVNELKKTVADNVKHLLPDTSTATTGQILKLTGENKTPSWADEYSYTPPAYSETEVNTGQKWIDGKEIYCVVKEGTTSDTEGSETLLTVNANKILKTEVFIYTNTNTRMGVLPVSTVFAFNDQSIQINKGSTYLNCNYRLFCYYTKPDPAPETREDDTEPEPEEKKTLRKKATK